MIPTVLTEIKDIFYCDKKYRYLLEENLPFYLIAIYHSSATPNIFYYALKIVYILCVEYRSILKYQVEQFLIHIFFKVLQDPEGSTFLSSMLDVLYDISFFLII